MTNAFDVLTVAQQPVNFTRFPINSNKWKLQRYKIRKNFTKNKDSFPRGEFQRKRKANMPFATRVRYRPAGPGQGNGKNNTRNRFRFSSQRTKKTAHLSGAPQHICFRIPPAPHPLPGRCGKKIRTIPEPGSSRACRAPRRTGSHAACGKASCSTRPVRRCCKCKCGSSRDRKYCRSAK